MMLILPQLKMMTPVSLFISVKALSVLACASVHD